MSKSQKGSKYEREFAKRLSLWWTQHDPTPSDDVFWRTSQSGGRATTRAKKGKATRGHSGDIGATDDVGIPLMRCFAIENKRGYNRDTVMDIIDRPSKKNTVQEYEKWFEQAERSRKASGAAHWLLVVKRDGRDPAVLMDTYAMFWLRLVTGPVLTLKCGRNDVTMMSLASFLEACDPRAIRREYEKDYHKDKKA